MRAFFYVDGFNFYYLRLKAQPQHKWLNIKKLADIIVPDDTSVLRVNYYTADISGKYNPEGYRRQQLLFSALRTVPEVKIHKGRFQKKELWARLAKPPRARPEPYLWNQPEPQDAFIVRMEEKGSDVSLGAHLVQDAFNNEFDVAYVITNDTDLVEPIRIVNCVIGKKICIVAP